MHSQSTGKLTRYVAHSRRGGETIDDAGILPDFKGVAVHDGWAPYRNYEGSVHALCNGHHLRELVAATEAGHSWPETMSALLLDAKERVERAPEGDGCLDPQVLGELAYGAIIAWGHTEHPPVEGKGKRTKAHNLLLRLERDRDGVLRFAHDSAPVHQQPGRAGHPDGQAPAEDLRLLSDRRGRRAFPGRFRGYISTARKNGIAPLAVLGQLSAGRPWLPMASGP